MIIRTILFTAFLGALIGVCWSFAIETRFVTGLIYGSIIGLALGASTYYFLRPAGDNKHGRELFFLTASFSLLTFIVGVVPALMAFIIRIIFF